jgi:hypothetical protein
MFRPSKKYPSRGTALFYSDITHQTKLDQKKTVKNKPLKRLPCSAHFLGLVRAKGIGERRQVRGLR